MSSPFTSLVFSMKNWRPSPFLIFHLLPATTPSTVAFVSVQVLPSKLTLIFWPELSVTASSASPGRVSPSASRSLPGLAKRAIQSAESATGLNVSVGSDESSVGAAPGLTAKIRPPGMPSSDSTSVCTCDVMLIWSFALPWRKIPYCSRNSKFVANATTPQNFVSPSESPVSSTNDAAPEAMLPSLITLIVPLAVSVNRGCPSFWPISRLTLPRISRIGSSGVRSASRNSMPPEMSM